MKALCNCAGAIRKDVIIFFFFIFDEEANTTVPVEADVENDEELEFFFDDKVRKVWHKQKEEWYFSVVDVVAVLTDSPNPNNYWKVLKNRLNKEGNQSVTNCNQLKMKSPKDGKMYKTDAANTEQILCIIQSIPSKHTESFKSWLGKCRAMTDNEENSYTETLFEAIKHVNEYGNEFWFARELQKALEYTEWRNFSKVIDRAINACENSGNSVADHFVEINKIVEAGATSKPIDDYQLSRYACYLIVQNGDSRKKVIALGQTYFAVKTRQQELIENFDDLSEEKKRLAIRNEMRTHNKSLAEAAKMAGISEPRDYAIFQNKGYQGLYGGLGRKEIHARKGLKKSQDILDYMGSTELAANLFRATQTDEKLRKEKILGKEAANQTHYEIGRKVRQTIKEIGGTMPEDLPTPAKGIKQIEREQKKEIEE